MGDITKAINNTDHIGVDNVFRIQGFYQHSQRKINKKQLNNKHMESHLIICWELGGLGNTVRG